jgi:hypothetical protein
MRTKAILKYKKGAGLIVGLISGIAFLVVATIVSLVIIDTIDQADLVPLGDTTTDNESSLVIDRLIGNYTTGIDNVSGKLPTILLLAAVVLLFGAIILLVARSRSMGGGGSEV